LVGAINRKWVQARSDKATKKKKKKKKKSSVQEDDKVCCCCCCTRQRAWGSFMYTFGDGRRGGGAKTSRAGRNKYRGRNVLLLGGHKTEGFRTQSSSCDVVVVAAAAKTLSQHRQNRQPPAKGKKRKKYLSKTSNYDSS
jgi:hypothetical protein